MKLLFWLAVGNILYKHYDEDEKEMAYEILKCVQNAVFAYVRIFICRYLC